MWVSSRSGLCDLPEEITVTIFKFLDVTDLLKLKQVNHQFYNLIHGPSIGREFGIIKVNSVFSYRNLHQYLVFAKNLTKLYIHANVCGSLDFLLCCSKLKILVLRGYYSGFSEITLLKYLSVCKQLRGLDVSGFTSRTKDFFISISKNLPDLNSFRSVDTVRVSPSVMWMLLGNLV